MIWIAVVGAAWVMVALVVAIALGRAAARADREELGSDFVWDIHEIDRETHESR